MALLLAACGGKSSTTEPDAALPDPEVDAAVDTSCAAQGCAPGEICSVTGVCIPEGTCAADGDCGSGMVCNPDTKVCELGGCGGQPLNLTYVPPNLHLVLDRSCSMRNEISAGVRKWTAAVGSLAQVLTNYDDDVRWGLTLFPDTEGTNCSQGASAFPVADGQAPAIKTLLEAALSTADPNYPDGPCVTNIDTGIQRAALDPGLDDPSRASYLMLISDGAQSGCSDAGGDSGTEMQLAELYGTRGVPTFVVGFGAAVDAAQLDKFAIQGGTALPGTPKYYQADTAAQLDQAFQQIANLVVSCTYTVDPAPADLAMTYVYYSNTELVPHDTSHMAGWDYDPATMSLTFYGPYCDRLKSREVTDVDVIFGCPTPPIE